MDFDLSEEQKGIQKAAEEFAKGEFDKEQWCPGDVVKFLKQVRVTKVSGLHGII